MTANNNTVKPIMVGHVTLTQLEQCWDSSISDDPNDKAEEYDVLLKTFQEVCARLRKEVKRHKKTKKKLAELQAEQNVIDANFKLMADQLIDCCNRKQET